MARGRPSTFTYEKGREICERLMGGESLRTICKTEGMPDRHTVIAWAEQFPDFHAHYTRARDIGWDQRAEAAVESAQTAEDASKGRLAFDAERWYLSKMSRRYGDKVAVEHSGGIKTSRELTDDELARIAGSGSGGTAGEA